jgi:hypothetical protein
MPANLNALIRYKTINSCLFGGKRKYYIEELIDACSAALSEARGRTTRISERTIRDDIRILRSDILGFNAPIEQKDGLYYYSDPKYTALTINITDPGLLEMIIKSLLRISKDVKHPELEIILQKLRSLAPLSFETEKGERNILYNLSEEAFSESSIPKHRALRFKMFKIEEEANDNLISFSLPDFINVSWGEIFNVLK